MKLSVLRRSIAISVRFLVLLAALMFGPQAALSQSLDQDSADCVAASNAPISRSFPEIDVRIQNFGSGNDRTSWIVYDGRVDYCLRAAVASTLWFRRAWFDLYFESNVAETIAPRGAFELAGALQRLGAEMERRVAARCGDDRACRVEQADDVITRAIRRDQITLLRFEYPGGRDTLVFIGDQLQGGVRESLNSSGNVTRIGDMRFSEL